MSAFHVPILPSTFPWIVILLMAVLIYVGVFLLQRRFFLQEMQKRKAILADVDLYKKTHPPSEITEASDTKPGDQPFYMADQLRKKGKEKRDPKYYQHLRQLVKQRRPHPYRLLALIIFQFTIYMLFLAYFHQTSYVPDSFPWYAFALGAFSLNILTPGFKRLKIVLVGLLAFIYSFFTADMLAFAACCTLAKLLVRRISKRSNEKQ